MPKITIYSTRTCPYCHMLKSYLESKQVAYEEVLLDDQPEKAVEALHICNSMGVPCTHIVLDDGTEERVLGFNKPKIDQVLGLS